MHDDKIEMCSTNNEEKSTAVGRFTRTLKNDIYRQMTAVLKHVYIHNISQKIRTKSQVGDNVKGSKFKIGGHVRISKYKHVFGKGFTSNWS